MASKIAMRASPCRSEKDRRRLSPDMRRGDGRIQISPLEIHHEPKAIREGDIARS